MLDNEVIVGVTPTTSVILDEEFPALKKVSIEPYAIKYSSWLPLSFKLLMDSFRISRVISKEKRQLDVIIKEHHVSVVISDNRFGLYHSKVECVYITHQLNIQAGWLSRIANKIHHHYIKQFNQVWVPDFDESTKCLAGLLSRNHRLDNVTYIGPLSRLMPSNIIVEDLDYLFLLSGPEPQRTILETLLLEIAVKSNKSVCMVRGSDVPLSVKSDTTMSVINYATSDQLSNLMQCTKTIVCRSGYSTLMDLNALHKKNIILIPTPGQQEQEYLANYWKETFQAKIVLQKDLKDLLIADF
jgi:hypothetical protein